MPRNELKRLREHGYDLRALPDALTRPWVTQHAMPIEGATLDDLAIVAMATEAEASALSDRARALRKLYELAHRSGARGLDLAVQAAARGLG